MFCFTASSTNFCSIALTLLLLVVFLFPIHISMIHKRSCSLNTKVNRTFYDMVKIRVVITQNVNIFTMYETLFEMGHNNFTDNLPK